MEIILCQTVFMTKSTNSYNLIRKLSWSVILKWKAFIIVKDSCLINTFYILQFRDLENIQADLREVYELWHHFGGKVPIRGQLG